jgi:hypothetical protein
LDQKCRESVSAVSFRTGFFMLRLANNDDRLLSHADDRCNRVNPDKRATGLGQTG